MDELHCLEHRFPPVSASIDLWSPSSLSIQFTIHTDGVSTVLEEGWCCLRPSVLEVASQILFALLHHHYQLILVHFTAMEYRVGECGDVTETSQNIEEKLTNQTAWWRISILAISGVVRLHWWMPSEMLRQYPIDQLPEGEITVEKGYCSHKYIK